MFYFFIYRVLSSSIQLAISFNQYSNIGLFSDGFTTLERKYIKFLIMLMSGEIENVRKIDIRKVLKKDLHTVRILLIFISFTRLLFMTLTFFTYLICQGTRDKIVTRFTGLDTILVRKIRNLTLSESLRDSVSG